MRAASTAVRTAVDTRVKLPSACPSRLAATDSATLRNLRSVAYNGVKMAHDGRTKVIETIGKRHLYVGMLRDNSILNKEGINAFLSMALKGTDQTLDHGLVFQSFKYAPR